MGTPKPSRKRKFSAMTPSPSRDRGSPMRSPRSPSLLRSPSFFGHGTPSPSNKNRNRGLRELIWSESPARSHSMQSPARLNRTLNFLTPKPKASIRNASFSFSPSAETPLQTKPRTLSFMTPIKDGDSNSDLDSEQSTPRLLNLPFSPSKSADVPSTPAPTNRALNFFTPNAKLMTSARTDSPTTHSNVNDDSSFLAMLAVDDGPNCAPEMFIQSVSSSADSEATQRGNLSAFECDISKVKDQIADFDDDPNEDSDGDSVMSVNLDFEASANPQISVSDYFGRLAHILADSESARNDMAPKVLARACDGDERARMTIFRALIARTQNTEGYEDEKEKETVDRLWVEVQKLDREIVDYVGDAAKTYRSLLDCVQRNAAEKFQTPQRKSRDPRNRPHLTRSADRSMFETPAAAPRPDPNESQSTDRARRDPKAPMRPLTELMEMEYEREQNGRAQPKNGKKRRNSGQF